MENPSNRHITTSIIVLIATTLLIGGAVLASQQNASKKDIAATAPPKNQAKPSPTPTNNSSDPALPVSPSGYRDGNYTASATYQSPGGNQEIKLNINLLDGKIMATSAEGDNKSSDSRFYQSSFIKGYKEKVIGKPIEKVKLDHVGNSSLTPQGFNKALEDIKKQAKA